MTTSISQFSNVQFDLLKNFPLLVPTNADFSSYEGFMEVKDLLFRVSLFAPNYPSTKDVILNCDWELSELLNGHHDTLKQWGNSDMTIAIFLRKLSELLINTLQNGEASHLAVEKRTAGCEEHFNNLQWYSAILSELQELGTNHLGSMSSDLRNISLIAQNVHGDLNTLNLKLSHEFCEDAGEKHYFEVVDTDLPEAVSKLIQKEPSITRAYRTFCEQIETLCSIWNALSLIDECCWVIDPSHPRKADMYRRIFISPPSVMAQLSWDPLIPNQPPDIKFQGADAEIDALRRTYEEHMEDWNQDSSILDNMCSVFQLSSLPCPPPPAPSNISQTVETGECCICYNVQLEGKLPEESCGKCLSSFHTSCLYEWLEMMPGSRQVHGHISGTCPNCETAIKCPCPHALE